VRKTADIVVIGAGITGCAIAWELARRRAGHVVLVDRRFVASGQTGRSTGVVRQHYTVPTLAQMARDSVRVFEDFASRVGGESGFCRCGYVILSGFGNAALLAKTVEMHGRLGILVALLSADELKAFEPRLNVSDVACGAFEPDGGYADPALAAHSFCEAARGDGAEVLMRTKVLALRVRRGRIVGVSTDQGPIATRTVVNAAGPWAGAIALSVGLKVPLRIVRHAVTVIRRPPSWRHATPVWADLATGWFFRPDAESLMCGSLEDHPRSVNPDTADALASRAEVSRASASATHRFPVLEEGIPQRAWAGLFDVTPDGLPILDRAPDVEGLFCAFGFSGHGFKLAPAVARIVSEQVVEGECRSYDVSGFRFDRFASGERRRGGYAYSIVA
jgi:glycine/D-amino acid oxidase-like deaminating enzyme